MAYANNMQNIILNPTLRISQYIFNHSKTTSKAIFFTFCILINFISPDLLGQTKFEAEKRIKEGAVPSKALEIIKNFPFDSKIKWYQESSNEGTTVEAKTHFQNSKYSIEFDHNGNLLDIEHQLDFTSLPTSIQKEICDHLNGFFNKYRITKIQEQWKGEEHYLRDLVLKKDVKNTYSQQYELIATGKIENDHKSFEFLYNEDGKIIQAIEVLPRASVNIEF